MPSLAVLLLFHLSVPPYETLCKGHTVAGVQTTDKILTLLKGFRKPLFLLCFINPKARSFFFYHVFPHVLDICFSREPVKREDASWCGHKNEPRENPTENEAKILFSAVRNEIFR